jgi:nitroreductase
VDLAEVMRSTGAIREFVDEPVDDTALREIFELARFAPSGGNRQGWKVIVVRDPAKRARLQEMSRAGWREYAAYVAAGRVPFAPGPDGKWTGPPDDVDAAGIDVPGAVEAIHEAPVLAVLAADLQQLAVTDIDLDRQSIVGGASVYPFAQNVLLAARDLGMGGVLTTFLCRRESEVKELLGIPTPYAVAALLALGRPTRFPTRLRRKEVDELVAIDDFTGRPLR